MESEYLKSLLLNSRDVAKRYIMKLRLVNGLDPFSLNVSNLDYSIDGVPPVAYVDIASYLVFTHSFYSHVQMKAYKGLELYKYIESDIVVKVGTKIENNLIIFVGQDKHSQKANAKPLDVWCIIAKYGSVLLWPETVKFVVTLTPYYLLVIMQIPRKRQCHAQI